MTNGYTGALTEEYFTAVWEYISQARRHRCFGQKALRAPAAYGAELHTMELGGFTHRWYEYVPESVRQSGKPIPLVVCMHGLGGSAKPLWSFPA